MRTIWNKPPPPNKKYVTRDELPQLVRRAIADMIMGANTDHMVPRVEQLIVTDAWHRRAFPAGSIGAVKPEPRPVIKRGKRGGPRRACGHKNRMSACQTCTS